MGLGNSPCFASVLQSLKHIWEMREFGSHLPGAFLDSCSLNITFLTMIMSLFSHLQSTYFYRNKCLLMSLVESTR